MPLGLTVPSGRSESQRSQIVVAPIWTAYSQDGVLGLEQQPVRRVGVTVRAQRVADQRGADEAGGDPVPVLLDDLGEPVGGATTLVLGLG